MKNMAKKFLEGCGVLKPAGQENLAQKKLPINNIIVKEPAVEQKKSKEFAPIQEPVSSKVEKCDFSLTKYELVENTIQ